jgi:hypothetical protein
MDDECSSKTENITKMSTSNIISAHFFMISNHTSWYGILKAL